MSDIDDTPLSLGAQDRARLHEALDTALNTPDGRGLYINVITFGVEGTQAVGLVLGQVSPSDIIKASAGSCKHVIEKMEAYQADLAREPRQ